MRPRSGKPKGRDKAEEKRGCGSGKRRTQIGNHEWEKWWWLSLFLPLGGTGPGVFSGYVKGRLRVELDIVPNIGTKTFQIKVKPTK